MNQPSPVASQPSTTPRPWSELVSEERKSFEKIAFAAVENGDVAVLKKALEACPELAREGREPQWPHNPDAPSLLAFAAARSAECFREILPGADLGSREKHGVTPLMIAATTGQRDILQMLLPLTDPQAGNRDGLDALMAAAGAGDAAAVEILLPVSNPLAQSASGTTALMHAVRGGSMECIRALWAVSDLKAADSRGETLLFLAAMSRKPDLVRLFAGVCDVNRSNRAGRTALAQAVENASLATTALLARSWEVVDALAVVANEKEALAHYRRHKDKMPAFGAVLEARELQQALGAAAEASPTASPGNCAPKSAEPAAARKASRI